MGVSAKRKLDSKKPTVISLFTCGMGMDLGFEKAKFQTVYANDIRKFACNTLQKNRPKKSLFEKMKADGFNFSRCHQRAILCYSKALIPHLKKF